MPATRAASVRSFSVGAVTGSPSELSSGIHPSVGPILLGPTLLGLNLYYKWIACRLPSSIGAMAGARRWIVLGLLAAAVNQALSGEFTVDYRNGTVVRSGIYGDFRVLRHSPCRSESRSQL